MKKILDRILAVKSDNSVASFARSLGLSQPSVHYYLNGERELSLKFIYNVCYRYHVSADWLLGFTDDPKGTAAPATDPTLAALIAEKDAEIARLKGKIEGLELAFKAFGKGE
jgi:transcriptional regulator with XRE-family HTH domain